MLCNNTEEWGWGGRVVGRRFKKEGTYVYLRLFHADTWQKPTQYYKAIILQLKINKLKKKKNTEVGCHFLLQGIFPDPRIKPITPAMADGFFTTELPRKPLIYYLLLCFWAPSMWKEPSNLLSWLQTITFYSSTSWRGCLIGISSSASLKLNLGSSQAVQWLRFHVSNAGGAGLIPGRGN